MKLYDIGFSPYSSRVRIVVLLKGLPIEIGPPPLALRSEAFKARHPLGKIPILELDDGTFVADSWVIMEYLEDMFPDVELRPGDALGCARMRLLGRIADLHLSPALFPLFGELTTPAGDAAIVQRQLHSVSAEILKLGRVLDEMAPLGNTPAAPGTRVLNLGDIALATTMYFVEAIPPLFSAGSAITGSPTVARWFESIRKVPAVSQTLAEIDMGFRSYLKQIGRA